MTCDLLLGGTTGESAFSTRLLLCASLNSRSKRYPPCKADLYSLVSLTAGLLVSNCPSFSNAAFVQANRSSIGCVPCFFFCFASFAVSIKERFLAQDFKSLFLDGWDWGLETFTNCSTFEFARVKRLEDSALQIKSLEKLFAFPRVFFCFSCIKKPI